MRRLASDHPAAIAIIVAATVYALSLMALLREPGAALIEPLFLFCVLGIVTPGLAYALTRKPRLVSRPLIAPPTRLGGVLTYLLMFSLLVLGWIFSAVQSAWPEASTRSVVVAALKLLTMVVLPGWLFLRGFPQRPRLGPARLWFVFVAMGSALFVFQAVFGRGLSGLRELDPALPVLLWALPSCWAWQVIEAGLCEEVLFRRILQQRIADATRSQVAAVLWASLLFGLAHAPGLYLRGAHLTEGVTDPTPIWALAYSVAMIAPAGIAFGVLWARTRSLWLVVVLHGSVDLLPQLAPFIRPWS